MRISDWSSDVCSSDLDRGLLNPRGHRSLLDEFGGLSAELVAVEHAFGAWREAGERLAALRDELETAARDREWLDHAVAELNMLNPRAGEEAEQIGRAHV